MSTRRMNICSALLTAALFAGNAEAKPPSHGASADDPAARWLKQGVAVGAFMDNLTAYSLEGKAAPIAPLWKDRPMLLVSASLTCPVARRECPKLRNLIDSHEPKIRIMIVYTIDAHPSGDDSPYRPGREWVTPQNERDGILHRQPTSLEQRLVLARSLHAELHEVAPMIVDAMDNSIWKAMGSGPNTSMLIDTDGRIFARQGWFDTERASTDIRSLLESRNAKAMIDYEIGRTVRSEMEAFIEAVRGGERSSREKFYSPHAVMWFDQQTGPGRPVAVSPWRAWDEELNATHTVEDARIVANTVIVRSTEVNDFARLIDFSGWRSNMTYRFQDNGRIHEILYEPQDVSPTFRECFAPAREWALKNKPEEMKVIFPGNEFAPSAETARRWRAVLIEWRKATGLADADLER